MGSLKGRLIDYDPVTKTASYFHETGEGDFAVVDFQDVEPVLEANKAAFNQVDERARYGDKIGKATRVASIPLVVWWELERLGIAKDEAALRKFLNASENVGFRTRPGRV